MAGSASGGARFIKYGCLGCVGLVAVVAILIAAVVGIAWVGAEDPVVEDRVRTHEVARPEPVGDGSASGSPTRTATEALPQRPGSITLDIANADCEIMPGEPGAPLKVDARFDTNTYAMEEAFDDPGSGAWTYRLAFRREGGGFFASMREMFSSSRPKLEIQLPEGVPFALTLEASQGGCMVDLGGLWLTEAALRANMSGLLLRIDDPTVEPLERLDVDIRMAGVQLDGLGNASPRQLNVDVRMAGMELDLRGAWRNDSDILVGLRQGGGTLRLPDDVDVEGLDAKGIRREAAPEVPRPILRFSPRSVLDDVDVRR